MKTNNNVQKTVLRTAAVIASFVLISFTVAAQDFWKTVLTKSSFNQIAMAMAETSKKSEVTESAIVNSAANYLYENDYEEKLEVEDWMTSNEYFNTVSFIQVESENDLQVENWMLNDNLFDSSEKESQLKIESWMTSNAAWN